jgi:hypothetical protein
MFGERGIVLCLFNLKLLYTRFITRNGPVSLLCIHCSLLFCDILLCYCFPSVYFTVHCSCNCTVSACYVRAATLIKVFPCFFLSCKANARV